MQTFARSLHLLHTAVDEGVCPSAAAAVGLCGEVLASAVYGTACEAEGGRPATPAAMDTLYDMASLTKVLSTTMTAFRLIEDGRLRLYDRIGTFFETGSEKSDITIKQLMTHTSGIPAHIMLSRFTSNPDESVRIILDTPLAAPPGTCEIYSCMGYILLGKILEQIGGAPLNVLADRLVFRPLDMRHTGYLPSGGTIAATERGSDGTSLKGIVHDENARFLGGVSGNAGVFSNLEDCTRFASMLARGGAVPGGRFLSPAMLRAATRNYTPEMDENRGLGFLLAGKGSFCGDLFSPESFGHTGFTGTSLLVDPVSGLWVVLLTNRVHPTRDNIRLTRFRTLFHNSIMAESGL